MQVKIKKNGFMFKYTVCFLTVFNYTGFKYATRKKILGIIILFQYMFFLYCVKLLTNKNIKIKKHWIIISSNKNSNFNNMFSMHA